MNKTKLALASLLTIASASAFSQAAAPAAPAPTPEWTITGNAGLFSDYRFRGISQNSKEITPEAALTLTGPDGFYVSAWSAKTNWGGNNPSYELDLYGGKHFDLGGTDLNVVAYY